MEKPVSSSQINARNRLLRRLPNDALCFQLGNYNVEIVDIHYHLPNFKKCIWHSHSFFEVHIIINGQGRVVSHNGTKIFKEGDIVISRPNFEHSWDTDVDDLYMYVIKFELNRVKDTQNSVNPVDIVLAQLFDVEDFISQCPEDAYRAIECIENEINSPKPGVHYMLMNYTRELIISIARTVNDALAGVSESVKLEKSEQDHLVVLINKYLEDNYKKDISLDMVARFACKSKRSVMRHYKAATGMTVIEKLLQMRLFEAIELLLEDYDKPVKTVAYEIGMACESYFCRQFKRFFGCTPTDYRRINSAKIDAPGQ
ncbi:AraC family transcriptional regulator [Limihaloglobus sulfuriphilus]|uniref:AraC family transcriptional regulator n=1 Tax=Limihaloglobus sulfuriphilus TaxID=1851148 RepID=UPI0011BA56CD|nr:AraC family transcriptional regulator [Limihaloglobus sulfuriphilus]